ncbi:type II secretion system F family protein [Paenibacillus sp. YYML68]|uniref:type II secretion system F family protein n=1 Tax=Paenibacillus sp. YYML68 TaxID=2909250 RepID=UPI002492586B|nr:hypothetical protein [Paenibacillus sp. YYML68]
MGTMQGAVADGQLWLSLIRALLLAMWIAGTLGVILVLTRHISSSWTYRSRHPALYRLQAGTEARRGLLSKVLRHLQDELDLAELKVSPELALVGMVLTALVGFFGSDAALQMMSATVPEAYRTGSTHVWALSVLLAGIGGSLPYFAIRFRVQRKRHRIALRMIVLVQNVIGHYRPSLTLAEIIAGSSQAMPYEVRAEWRRLELALHMKSIEEALHEFARRVDNEWAHDLVDLLLIGAHYGADMTESLHHLVSKMQTSKRHEDKRLAMITVYRIGTSFMVGFALFVIGFNVYADPTNYKHYFAEPGGIAVLAASFAVMFVSMVLVVRTGRKSF